MNCNCGASSVFRHNGRVNNLTKNCAVESPASAQFALYVHASVEQLESVALCRGRNLRHLHVLKVLQEHKLHDSQKRPQPDHEAHLLRSPPNKREDQRENGTPTHNVRHPATRRSQPLHVALHELHQEEDRTRQNHSCLDRKSSGTQEGVRGCQAPHPVARHPGGSGGSLGAVRPVTWFQYLTTSARRKRREVIRTDTRNLVPVERETHLILSTDPDDLDALRREPGGQTSTSVPVVGLALDAVVELNPLIRTTGRLSSVEALSHSLGRRPPHFFPQGKV